MLHIRTQTARVPRCPPPTTPPPETHPTHPGPRDQQPVRGPTGIFPDGTWGQGLGLCVLSSCPSCVSALRGMAETHDLIYLLCLESHRDWREGEAPRVYHELIGLPVWQFYVCDWRHLGQVFLVGPQSRVQATWSRKMPVWHPHRWW